MTKNMINILLCGGSGARLWPISRERYPKQFCGISGEESPFQRTLSRNAPLCAKTLIVTNEEHFFIAKAQIEAINAQNIEFILESAGRNTAPAIALACFALGGDEIALVTPADHHIGDTVRYAQAAAKAQALAAAGNLVTFGVKPAYPETGFGYIEASGEDVLSFREKPDEDTARAYLAAGNYLWNSGMFAFCAKTYLEELKRHAAPIYTAAAEAYENRRTEKDAVRIPLAYMERIPKDSVDYAVMEKSVNIKVVEAELDWSDLGSFEAVAALSGGDENGNAAPEKAVLQGAKRNFILSGDKPVALVDADDLIVVDSGDALFISKKGSSQKIKDILPALEGMTPGITKTPATAYRPWGTYTVLEEGGRYKIKKIVVKPGQRLSLQKHYHRSEHWTVVSGTAKITLAEKEVLCSANESVYIPIGALHRLENPGKIDLTIIETSVGEYIREDDIVRVADTYGRVPE